MINNSIVMEKHHSEIGYQKLHLNNRYNRKYVLRGAGEEKSKTYVWWRSNLSDHFIYGFLLLYTSSNGEQVSRRINLLSYRTYPRTSVDSCGKKKNWCFASFCLPLGDPITVFFRSQKSWQWYLLVMAHFQQACIDPNKR